MIRWLFAKMGFRWALQATAEAQLTDLQDWAAKLTVSDYSFTEEQRDLIEKLFPAEVESRYSKEVKRAWYKAARTALPVAIKAKREYLEAQRKGTETDVENSQ